MLLNRYSHNDVKEFAQAVCAVLEASDREWKNTCSITSGAPVEVTGLAQQCRDIACRIAGIEVALESREISGMPLSYGSSNRKAAEILKLPRESRFGVGWRRP